MHETYIIKNMIRFFSQKEAESSKKIKKVYVVLSEFGNITPEHFIEHYKDESRGTQWEFVDLDIKKIPYGPELEITKLEFENPN